VNGHAAAVLVAAAAGALTACATRAVRVPDDVSGYDLLVPGHDPVSLALARALTREGFRVRTLVRGGNQPTAVLIHFVFSDGPGAPPVFYGRLTDTRTGRVVVAASIPLQDVSAARDSVPSLARALAKKSS
jgi:hypothetical protein